jgi:hypothetical protein
MTNSSRTPSGSIDDFEATHSLEQVKQLAVDKGVSTAGTKHEITTRIFKDKPKLLSPPKIADEAVYHISEAVRKSTGFDWRQVKGIFVGGCVERGVGSSFRAKAHAHNNLKDKHFGWICLRSIKRVGEVQGHEITNPSRLLWHEYAHILTPNHYHDDAWRGTMKVLGQPLEEQYKKKKRPPARTYVLACQFCGHVWPGPYSNTCPKCGSHVIVMTPKEK